MPHDITAVRSTLNDLIETCKDSQKGFHAAAEKVKDPEAHHLFLHLYLQRSEFAGELQAEVTRSGGDAAETGTTLGTIHRGWMGLMTALAADSDHEILVEAERGEEAAVKNYIAALRSELPHDIDAIVARQFRMIQEAHRAVKELLDKHPEKSDLPMAGLR